MFRIISPLSKINLVTPIICVLSFFVFSTVSSQQKNSLIEDDYEILKDKIRLYFNESNDRSLLYAEQMSKSSNYEHLAFANGAMSFLLQRKGETEKSNEKYKKAIAYLKKMPDSQAKKRVTADVYNYGGLTEWNRGNYGEALKKFNDGSQISAEIGDMKQVMKFKGNTALINGSVGNYQLAIKNSKEVLDFIDKNENLFTKEEILNRRSNVNLNLGSSYEDSFNANQKKWEFLDSAAYYYKQTIKYSETYSYNLISAKVSLGNIYNWKNDYKKAEEKYSEAVALSKQNNFGDLLCVAYYDLADIYLTAKKYNKALFFYKKSDSVALLSPLTNTTEYTYFKSNCYQARIYNKLNMPELAHKHSKIFLDRLDKFERKLREERLKVNYKQGEDNLAAEMLSIDKKYKKDLFFTRSLTVLYILLLFGILFFLIKNKRDKKKTHKIMIDLMSGIHTNRK